MTKSFKGYDDYSAASVAAKSAVAADLGMHWRLIPGASVLARLPAAWVACKVYGRTSKSPRDVRLPAARYWPTGQLPDGALYSPEYQWEAPFASEAEQRAAILAKYQTLLPLRSRWSEVPLSQAA